MELSSLSLTFQALMACLYYSLWMANASRHWAKRRCSRLCELLRRHFTRLYRFLLSHYNPLCIRIIYLFSISSVGLLVLKSLKLKQPSNSARDIDMFFMAVSAATVSSMSTVEMEVFSNSQLVVLAILMLIGGELFGSMLGLQFRKEQLKQQAMTKSCVESVAGSSPDIKDDQFEMESSAGPDPDRIEAGMVGSQSHLIDSKDLKYNAITYLGYVVMGYLLLMHVGGFVSVMVYMSLVTSARTVLKDKGIGILIFSFFTTISSFSNGGFIPTNENMLVFKKNSGLLLLIIPQVLLGNTMFPSCLRLLLWVLKSMTGRAEFEYMLKNSQEIGYFHLLPHLSSLLLVATVLLFVVIQLVFFCAMEWHSEALSGMNFYQKVIGALFLSVNSRHAGESIADISSLSPAILVLFAIMMYLPSHTSFMPFKHERFAPTNQDKAKKSMGLLKSLAVSQLTHLAIFVILICISERKKIPEDPLNFSVFNIVIEVVSAYGNVGFSTGYSCSRQLKHDGVCKDAWYGFVGRWSDQGKLILIFVMFFGRLKKYNMRGGKAWKLN
ncbi:Sodium transporter HKT1 [Cocos nucifera]|uniref:Sodium transporter HKT1 n=1 Tax=Cocos nucifera TaxID=13894 RepID=A0A8K0MUR2_COCNU|nr:Sodium transporter HKT1 [Cocos nucifera]